MGIEHIRALKKAASEPKEKKWGTLNKKSAKAIEKEKEDAEILKKDD